MVHETPGGTKHEQTPRSTSRRTRTRRTPMEAVRRAAGMAVWLAAGEALIGVGSLQGTTGSWIAGWALYGIMAREWSDDTSSEDTLMRRLVRRHVKLTCAAGAIALGTTALMPGLTGTEWTMPWEQLPMVTIGLGALHNATWAPPTDQEDYYAGDPTTPAREPPGTDPGVEDR